jgi:hypothetical protein
LTWMKRGGYWSAAAASWNSCMPLRNAAWFLSSRLGGMGRPSSWETKPSITEFS